MAETAAAPKAEASTETTVRPRGAESESLAVGAAGTAAAVGVFLCSLEAKNRSAATVRAYEADVRQLLAWLAENTLSLAPERVTRADITEYFAALGQRGLTRVQPRYDTVGEFASPSRGL